MVNNILLWAELAGTVGWRDVADRAIPRLAIPLTQSDSGLYFNDLSELVSPTTAFAAKDRLEDLSAYLEHLTKDAVLNLLGRYLTYTATVVRPECDLTAVLVANKLRFAHAIQLAVGIRMMIAMESSANVVPLLQGEAVNKAAVLRIEWERKLYGGKDPIGNHNPGELSRILLDLSALDPACKPPRKGGLISVSTLHR